MMKFRAIQKADWFLGMTLAAILAPIARALGAILKRDHSFESTRTIVVMKLLGGGNFALAMPMLLGLRRSFPKSNLVAVVTPATVEFAKAIGIFNSVSIIDTSSIYTLFVSALRTLISVFRVDLVLDLEIHSKLSTCFGLISCARNRLGFFTNDFFLRKHLYTHLVFFNPRALRPVLFEHFVSIIGGRCATYAECQSHLKNSITENSNGARIVTIGVGCSDLGRVRQLSAEQWLTVLSKELITSHDLCVIFIGSKGDWELSERISVELRKTRASAKVQNLCGSCSLLESLKVLGKSEHFFAIDSGLLHFARLLGVPSTSFWGPTDPATLLSFIPGYQEKVYYKPLICSPCIHVAEDPPCGGRNLCIDALFREESFPTSEVLVNITLEPQKRPKS